MYTTSSDPMAPTPVVSPDAEEVDTCMRTLTGTLGCVGSGPSGPSLVVETGWSTGLDVSFGSA